MTGKLLLAGTSHHLAPVAIREQLLSKGGERAVEALGQQVRARLGHAVIVSTCNRLEVFCWTERPRAAATLTRLLSRWSGLPLGTVQPYLYVHAGQEAAHHLLRVAAGLDSLVVGESQILGQIRGAWLAVRKESPLPPEFDGLFRQAIETARRIRAGGRLDRHPSVAGLAVSRAGIALPDGLDGRRAAVLGAGATGLEATRALLAAGAAHVTLLNRSHQRLADVDGLFAPGRVTPATLGDLPVALRDADVLICATASPLPVVPAALVAEAVRQRRGWPLLICDIAVPRDVEPGTRDVPGVTVIDLDDLAAACTADAATRHAVIAEAERQARQAADGYEAFVRQRRVVPDIVALRRQAETVRHEALGRARGRGRLRALDADQWGAVERLTHTIVQRLLHHPTIALRESAALPDAAGRSARKRLLAALTPASASDSQSPETRNSQ